MIFRLRWYKYVKVYLYWEYCSSRNLLKIFLFIKYINCIFSSNRKYKTIFGQLGIILTLIVVGGKSNLIVLGWGADLPKRLFWCFFIKFKSKTNIMLILWILQCLNEYFWFYRRLKKSNLIVFGGGADLPRLKVLESDNGGQMYFHL